MTPEQEAARAGFNQRFPEAAELGQSMYRAPVKGDSLDSDIINAGMIDRKDQGVNLMADLKRSAQQAAPPGADIPQLEQALLTTYNPEDRIRIQEALARSREEMTTSADTAARERATSDVKSIEAELKNVKDPSTRQVLEAELNRQKKFLGTAGVRNAAMASETVSTIDPEEGRTLQRFIENPGTSASERGKARLRLGELRKQQGYTGMPALERNYEGVAAPAGVSAPLGATVTTEPALRPAVSVEPIGATISVAREKVTEVDAQAEGAKQSSVEERAAQINESLNDQDRRQGLMALQAADQQKFPDQKDTPERKSFLESGLQSLFGDLFNKQELVRFSVLAAGGLLTGGSVGGSLRFAGLNTLQHSDQRRAQESAEKRAQATARATMQKELRADLRRMDADSIKALDKKAPEIQTTAIQWMNQAKALEMKGSYEASRELYRRANMLLTSAPDIDKTGAGGEDSVKNYKTGFYRGQPATMRTSKDGKVLEVFPQGRGWQGLADPNEFETREDFDKNLNDITTSTQRQLEPKLRQLLGKGRSSDADAQSKALAENFAALKHELGRYVTPKQFGQMAEITISQLNPDDVSNGRISPEALRKSFFLNSVMMLRQGDVDLFRSKDGKVDARAHAAFVDTLERDIAEKKKGNPEYGLSQASGAIIQQWDDLPAATRNRYEASAKDGRQGMTGFLRWVEDQRSKPKN